MTWTAQGVWNGSTNGSPTSTNIGIGNLLIVEVLNFSNSTVWATGLTGGGATWVQAGVKLSGTNTAQTAAVFLGTITATGAQTATITWSGTTPANFGSSSHEFSTSVGSWTFITQGNLDSTGTANWPSLNSTAGDLYFGYCGDAATATSGSTSGYTYNASADGAGNGAAYNVNCPGGATFPVWGDSGQQFGIAVLIREGTVAAPAPAALPALPGQTWLRRFHHRQVLPPAPLSVTTAATATLSGLGTLSATPQLAGTAALSGSGTLTASPAATVPPGVFPALPGRTWLRRFQHRQVLPPPAPSVKPYVAGVAGTGYNSWFVDQYGSPRLMVIEQCWSLPWNAGRWNSGNWQADYTAYFSNRSAQGYTAWYGLVWGSVHNDPTALSGGRTWDGIYPLTVNGTPGAIATGAETVALNSAFWSRVDAFFATARAYGIACFLNLGQTYDRTDTGAIWLNASNTQATAFGNALATRYPQAAYPHVHWFWGDDDGGGNDTFWAAMLTGMANAGDTRTLFSIEYLTNSTSHVETDNGAALGTFGAANAAYNWAYCYDASYFTCERAYTEGGTFTHIPAVYGDGIFYGDTGGGGGSVDYCIRTFVWWGLASGSRGFPATSGDSFADTSALWKWQSDAVSRLTSDPNGSFTTTTVGRIATYFSGLADWHKLIPDTGNVLVTGGRGTRGTCDPPGSGMNVRTGSNYVAAAITPTGSLAVLYCRAGFTSVTIDQTQVNGGGAYTATWVDPSNPTVTVAATVGSTYTRTSANGTGDPDWVLVLQAAPTTAATASLTGTGSLTASPVLAGTAALSGLGTLSASPSLTGTAALSGTGTLSVSGVSLGTAVTLSGSGTLSASPQLAGTAALSGSGTLSPLWTLNATVALSGSGTLSYAQGQAAASLSGTGTLSAAPGLAGTGALSGSGTLTATSTLTLAAAVALSGQGTLAAALRLSITAALSGTGTLTTLIQPAFTVGTLTASVAPGGAGGVLTASDVRLGGPGG